MNIASTRAVALGLLLATGLMATSAATPQRASANPTTTIAIAAAAIIGALLIDSNTNRAYYVRNNRRYYVNNNVAQYYYQQRDPVYYRSHYRDWQSNRAQFARDWQRSHHDQPTQRSSSRGNMRGHRGRPPQ